MGLQASQELFVAFFAIYFTLTIDRSFRDYKAYDTYQAMNLRDHALKRLMVAWVLLIIVPMIEFAYVVALLANVDVMFDTAPGDVLAIAVIGLLSFFEFGYYRIFEAVINRWPDKFYPPDELAETLDEERRRFWAHLVPGLMYILITLGLLAIVLMACE